MHSHLPFLLLLCVSLTFFSNRQPTSETAALPVVDGLSSLAGCPRWNRLCCLWPDALDGTASAGGARAVAGCVGCRCLITESDANSKRTVAISSVNSSYKTDQSVDLFNMGDSTATVSGGDNNSSERNAAEEVSRILEQSKELQESAAALISQNSQEEASLRQGALPLDSNIKSLHSFINSSVKKGNFDPKDSEKLVEELSRATYTLSEGDAAAFLPSKSYGRFLRTFLGPINVHAIRKDVQLKVKEEYNNFRDRTAYLFLFFPSLLLLLRSWVWNGCFPALPVQLYQLKFANC